ncbi:methionine--tRNA ligase, mitochondrial-like [Diadema antillarum]|uniref:methionine--tRNA ligase, mitochondrial-like n=1 Tax=Diadema antillarum TaxID=105358 RepID=UPI003A8B7EAC
MIVRQCVRRALLQPRWYSPHLAARCFQMSTPLSCTDSVQRDHQSSSLPTANKPFFTTPIFYVNSVPHIGHLYSACLADAAHRWQRIMGETDTIFATGTDEHGLKIQQAARQAQKEPQDFCDEVSQEFKRLFKLSSIDYTDFIRTTEERHHTAVHHFWNTLVDKGFIYKGEYEGWYSVTDESFLTNAQIQEIDRGDGSTIKVSVESGSVVEWTSEVNYMFRLSAFKDKLLRWLETNPQAVQPAKFHAIVTHWLEEGIQDLSVSRQRDRLPWGIPVPGDPSQTIYVWLDALVNYLTVSGYPEQKRLWPPTHIVGKDILKFHAIYWPAFLMAADISPPATVVCHSHWTRDNFKMSKSKGNVINPFDRLAHYTADGLRYFLLREGVLHSDGDYSDMKVSALLNAELADTFGNLLSRVAAPTLNPQQVFPILDANLFPSRPGASPTARSVDEDYLLVNSLHRLPEIVAENYNQFLFYRGLEEIMTCLRMANAFVQRHEPWNLAKNPVDRPWLDSIIHVTMEMLRVCGILAQPVVPRLTDRLLTKMGVAEGEREWKDLKCFEAMSGESKGCGGRQLSGDSSVLFSRLKTESRR